MRTLSAKAYKLKFGVPPEKVFPADKHITYFHREKLNSEVGFRMYEFGSVSHEGIHLYYRILVLWQKDFNTGDIKHFIEEVRLYKDYDELTKDKGELEAKIKEKNDTTN